MVPLVGFGEGAAESSDYFHVRDFVCVFRETVLFNEVFDAFGGDFGFDDVDVVACAEELGEELAGVLFLFVF